MEQILQPDFMIPEVEVIQSKQEKPFIEANTKNVSLSHLRNDCNIPVFSKDNESTLSHQEFIDTVYSCAQEVFQGQTINQPEIRTSHTIKGRIPSAIGKPVKELLENEKTIYYERMMFAIEIPSITSTLSGNQLTLTLGGVRAYNQENLYSKKNFEKFKIYVGFKNMVCCNMCVSSDGFVGDLRASSPEQLRQKVKEFLSSYQMQSHLETLERMPELGLTEEQFAQLIGRFKLFTYLPKEEKQSLLPVLLNESQISTLSRNYYEDEHFSREQDGSISFWKLYNLLTEANKSSYIDSFLDRSVNAHEIVSNLMFSLENEQPSWFLN